MSPLAEGRLRDLQAPRQAAAKGWFAQENPCGSSARAAPCRDLQDLCWMAGPLGHPLASLLLEVYPR